MPKGALLRAHCHSLVDIPHLIDVALNTPGICISCPDGNLATQHARKEGRLRIQFRAKADSEDGSLWGDGYAPNTYIALSKAADDYPEGGRQGFAEWLKGRRINSTQDSNLRADRGTSLACSEVMSGMIYYEPIWRAFLQRLMANLVEDGVYWLELR
jgi:adenosine deaminase CECR1